MVSNAGCRAQDLALLQEGLATFCSSTGGDVRLEVRNQDALLALQGPLAQAVLQVSAAESVHQCRQRGSLSRHSFICLLFLDIISFKISALDFLPGNFLS